MLPLHLEILDKRRLSILTQLKKFGEQLVLGGGSALCLQLGHRKSYDFDLFYSKPLTEKFFYKVRKIFGNDFEKLIDSQDQLSILLKKGVEITFLHYYYRPQFPLILTEFIPLYDVKDIALDKAHTVGRRGIWRDYVDLYFILKGKYIDLKTILEFSEKKFGSGFSAKLFLEQLTYFGDIEEYTIEFVKSPVTPTKIKKFLIDEVKHFKRQVL